MPTPNYPRAFSSGLLDNIKDEAEKKQQARVWSTAEATQFELERISRIIEAQSGCKLIAAGTKSLSSATRKVKGQCNGHWLEIGDIARVTLAGERQADVDKAIKLVEALSTSEGFSWMKREPKNAATDPCGYSGWNGVLRFGRKPISASVNHAAIATGKVAAKAAFLAPNSIGPGREPISQLRANMTGPQIMAAMQRPKHEVMAQVTKDILQAGYVGRTAEIQVNTYDLLYGKMSRGDYEGMFGAARWTDCLHRFGVQGGAGHLFYEDYRVDKESKKGKAIAELSKRYYGRMRGTNPRPKGLDVLVEEVDAYVELSNHPSVPYKKGDDGRWTVVS
jgi:hypothetical protein